MNVGKMHIKEGLTSHGSPPPGACHTDLSVENREHKITYLNLGVLKNPEAGGRGQTKGKKQQRNSKQATRAKLRGNGVNAHVQRDHLLTTGNLPVNYDY